MLGEEELCRAVAQLWGADEVVIPEAKRFVAYESDLGERHIIDFESGTATVEILLALGVDPTSPIVMEHARQGVRNMALSPGVDPYSLDASEHAAGQHRQQPSSYTVAKGDTLWGLARRFGVPRSALASINGLSPDARLGIGQELLLPQSPHALEPTEPPGERSAEPLLADQLCLENGDPVTAENADRFAEEVIDAHETRVRHVVGEDGTARQVASVAVRLVEDHLRQRALRVRPIVESIAAEYGIDPALVMAMIHTESAFNPRARSDAPAYGLMQIVPHTAGADASRFLFGRERRLTAEYLYNPQNNVRFGCAYIHILDTRYLQHISSPASRLYCVMAAYNGGVASVAQALTGSRSLKRAAAAANSLNPETVYSRLRRRLPSSETRNYIARISERMELYRPLTIADAG